MRLMAVNPENFRVGSVNYPPLWRSWQKCLPFQVHLFFLQYIRAEPLELFLPKLMLCEDDFSINNAWQVAMLWSTYEVQNSCLWHFNLYSDIKLVRYILNAGKLWKICLTQCIPILCWQHIGSTEVIMLPWHVFVEYLWIYVTEDWPFEMRIDGPAHLQWGERPVIWDKLSFFFFFTYLL